MNLNRLRAIWPASRRLFLLLCLSFASTGWQSAEPDQQQPPVMATPSSTTAVRASGDPSPASETATPEPAPTAVSYAEVGTYPRPSGAVVEVSSYYSATLERDMPYAVVLPPGYSAGDRRYAVLTMLHGWAGGYGSWLDIGLLDAFEQLYADGRIDPFIIALPEGEASYFLNHADGPAWGDYIALEFIGRIDRSYRTLGQASSRAVGGLSMGGEGALQLGLNYSDVFGVVGAHTPTTRLAYADAPGPFYRDEEYWQRHSALWLIENGDAVFKLRISIDDGYDDPWFPSAEALHSALLQRGVKHQYHVYAAGHDYWASVLDDYLQFYSSALETGGSDPGQPRGRRWPRVS